MNEPLTGMHRMVRSAAETGVRYGRMIKFSHSVFALPFALSAVILAQGMQPVRPVDVFWIMVAMVSARSAAMGFNRIADVTFDSRNPRTAGRELPSGKLSAGAASRFVIFSSMMFVLAAAMLGPVCVYLSVPVLLVLFGYSYTKRFTRFCHLYLGFAISLAPLGAWVALTNSFSAGVLFLSLGLMGHIAGFDIIYACQDTDFDIRENLFSLPAVLGVDAALLISTLIHVGSVVCFLLVYSFFDLHWTYLAAVGIIAVLFAIEHAIVTPGRLERINIAFFHINSVIGIILFAGILGGMVLR